MNIKEILKESQQRNLYFYIKIILPENAHFLCCACGKKHDKMKNIQHSKMPGNFNVTNDIILA